MKKIILKSDFLDFYDAWFDITRSATNLPCRKEDTKNSTEFFKRNSKNFISKREQFKILHNLGWETPKNGDILDFKHQNFKGRLVVYLDEYSHRGEDKILTTLDTIDGRTNLKGKYGHCYASEFIYLEEGSISKRVLYIGNRMKVSLTYSSDDIWRSNVGNVNVVVNKIEFGRYHYNFPLFAIDYLEYYGQKIAVDFNTSPQLRGTGLENLLQGKFVADLIKNFS